MIENNVLTHYTVSVIQSKIVTHKETTRLAGIIKADRQAEYIASKYLTPQSAIEAIKVVLPYAIEHLKTCQAELKAIENRLGFNFGYTYEGETYDIYNEYSYISFKLNGFNFEFEIER